ncbi:cytochrome c maturation protein CcmE [Bartonella tamiae]|uniref:Cytochrome c-type biogenesis protein CcmE n=1 Tax=Bartonella tamiae Th239 TaxID=1094558 RepID=J0ZPQ9_9HYPH|nr:cytochrome c maturation protein CcmE [Bartonella tamiae]EJF90583.1 hypothetical protein ME5_00984 [Bartonella tamiae Th239]EJF94039.1 hypothetical protein MEG_00897 [Bartonella tamiae Th307]
MMKSINKQMSLQQGLKRRKKKRLLMIVFGLVVLGIAVGLVLYAMRGSASFFRMPSEITTDDMTSMRSLRLGGFVEKGSVHKTDKTKVSFTITDYAKQEKVEFNGILPDLFREGQGIIAEGHFNQNGSFIADRVLAKHDETYVPKDIVDRLKAKGLWEEYQKNAR